jgi:hypothetical protein
MGHVDRLRSDGWNVIMEPEPTLLPVELRDFQPDMIAQRGDENLVVEVRGPRRTGADGPAPPPDRLAELAARIMDIPDWHLDLFWTGQDDPPAPAPVLADRARRAAALTDVDVEAALLLAWSALEGMLATRAEQAGVLSHAGVNLSAELHSRGLLDDPIYTQVRDAQRLATQVAYGRSAQIGRSQVQRLIDLTSSATLAA